ncbi:30S ribosomal protein S1 [Priestia koreensis]|uniref:30S ribosomal protein S1 n=1 Tax=Priestia koreensis TaxID=284581 RepID=UPI00203B34A6|nr:30S ribosomal protein S1 [Priestia koreensis]MCM3005754.1 30S ribosomal protein S1 [Priestia koreensis]
MEKTWNEDNLQALAEARRTNQILTAVVYGVQTMKLPINEDGKVVSREVETAIFMLPGGVTAYCPVNEFSDYEYRSLAGFAGTKQQVIIDRLDLDHQIAMVSVKKADELLAQKLWNEMKYLQDNEQLSTKVYDATIVGFNEKNEHIHLKMNGARAFMVRNDWDHGRVRDLGEQFDRGEHVEVKVVRFDEERQMIQVSRKATIDDPFAKLDELAKMDTIAGVIDSVHPIHGIFVKLSNGLVVKGMKPRDLAEPTVGEVVTCKVREINREQRKAKVVIVAYPRGKKKRKDITDFLFS